jgi:hypothetical protein
MPDDALDVSRLRWMIGQQDVTCENCHTAMYEPDPDDRYCDVCLAALGMDILAVRSRRWKRRTRKALSANQV